MIHVSTFNTIWGVRTVIKAVWAVLQKICNIEAEFWVKKSQTSQKYNFMTSFFPKNFPIPGTIFSLFLELIPPPLYTMEKSNAIFIYFFCKMHFISHIINFVCMWYWVKKWFSWNTVHIHSLKELFTFNYMFYLIP